MRKLRNYKKQRNTHGSAGFKLPNFVVNWLANRRSELGNQNWAGFSRYWSSNYRDAVNISNKLKRQGTKGISVKPNFFKGGFDVIDPDMRRWKRK